MKNKEVSKNLKHYLLGKLVSLIESDKVYEWSGYYIDMYEGNFVVSISMEIQEIEILITYDGGVWFTLREQSHREIVVRICKGINNEREEGRTVEEIEKDCETLIRVFMGYDFHNYMYVLNGLAVSKNDCFDYYEWYEAHKYYEDMNDEEP